MPDRVEQKLLDDNPQLCSAVEFAKLTGYTVYTIRQHCKLGKLPAVRIHTHTRSGWYWLIPRNMVENYTYRRVEYNRENAKQRWKGE